MADDPKKAAPAATATKAADAPVAPAAAPATPGQGAAATATTTTKGDDGKPVTVHVHVDPPKPPTIPAPTPDADVAPAGGFFRHRGQWVDAEGRPVPGYEDLGDDAEPPPKDRDAALPPRPADVFNQPAAGR